MYPGLTTSPVFLQGLFKPVLLFHFSLLGPLITGLALKSRENNLSGSTDNKEMQLLLSLVQGIHAAFCCGAWRGTR